MDQFGRPIKVLYSFPHRLGKARICTTAWYEIDSAARAGAELFVLAGDCVRPFQRPIQIKTTLSWHKLRIPYRLLGTMRACIIHDWLVARQLPMLAGQIDIIHAWPLGALNTIKIAKKLGIPVALERCNAHTRFAYEVVQRECERIGVRLPKGHEHAFNAEILRREEEEYRLADALLCPSDFVVKTFIEKGFREENLVRFIYGVDETKFFPDENRKVPESGGLKMIFVGVCAVRKGLHYALEAWLQSSASREGRFLIVGEFVPDYKKKLAPMLAHPSVEVLGHRDDVPALMRQCDLFILPSIEEGFGLVCTEAMASGCVPLVSEACTDLCRHGKNSLVHSVGDVKSLAYHIDLLNHDRGLLKRLRAQALADVNSFTWAAAGRSLVSAYKRIILQSPAPRGSRTLI